MNLDRARELLNKLNLGVGKAKTLSAYETKDIENPDGEVIGLKRVNERKLALGHVGPAMPCCLGDGNDHEEYCVMFGRDDFNPWEEQDWP